MFHADMFSMSGQFAKTELSHLIRQSLEENERHRQHHCRPWLCRILRKSADPCLQGGARPEKSFWNHKNNNHNLNLNLNNKNKNKNKKKNKNKNNNKNNNNNNNTSSSSNNNDNKAKVGRRLVYRKASPCFPVLRP